MMGANMGYADNNLIAGERVTYRVRLHWILLLKPALISFAVLAVVGVLLFVLNLERILSTPVILLAALPGLVLAALPTLFAYLGWRSAEFSVTNKRVILKVGLMQSKTAEMFLNKIESVGVDQSVLGRMLGYGDIVIRGTGGSLEPFRHVAHPLEFRNQIQEQIGNSFQPGVARNN